MAVDDLATLVVYLGLPEYFGLSSCRMAGKQIGWNDVNTAYIL